MSARGSLQPAENPITENIVEVGDLRFTYNKREVLKGINLNIPCGNILSINKNSSG